MKSKKLSLEDFESVEMAELLSSKGGSGGGVGNPPTYRCLSPWGSCFVSFVPCSQIGGGYATC